MYELERSTGLIMENLLLKGGCSPRRINRQLIALSRIDRAVFGNFGNTKGVGDEVFDFRIDYGSGVRVYFSIQGQKILLLLIGGTKRTQVCDIKKAKLYLKVGKVMAKKTATKNSEGIRQE